MAVNNWTRDELLAAFSLYCRTPFGKLHKGNPEIIGLAQRIGRTPSSVAMKLGNLASLDPVQQARQISGLANASRADREIWDEFNANPEQLAYESQQAFGQVSGESTAGEEPETPLPSGPTEALRLVRTRLVQGFFRDAVLSGYEFQCAMCRIDLPELMNASHIIPWSKSVERRADPRNGLCLCSLHDRAFDRGLISLDASLQILLSARAKQHTSSSPVFAAAFAQCEGEKIVLPKRFLPDPDALSYHREHIFKQ